MHKSKPFSIELSCLILLFSTLTFLFSSGKLPADDGFFYLEIANNVANGKGFHFNSLYETNGFHPLWEIVCIALAYINPFEYSFLIYIVWVTQLLLFFQGIRFLKIYWSNQLLSLIPLTILIVIFCCLGTIYLSEAFLNFFFLSLVLNKIDEFKSRPYYAGFLLSLVFLSRLDNIFIIGFLGLFLCFFQTRFSVSKFLKISGGFSILVIPYFIYNVVEFGSIMPVSGKIKNFFPYFEMGGFNNHSKIFLIVCIIYLIGLLTIFKKRYNHQIVLFFTLGAILQLVYNGVFQSQIGQWYFVAQFIVLGFLVYDFSVLVIKDVKSNFKLNLSVLLIYFCICSFISILKLTSGFTLLHFNNSRTFKIELKSDIEYFVEDLKRVLPQNARIYTYDIPGKIAYYSNFDVIAADGLINNEQFSTDLNKGNFEDFLKSKMIDYVILPSDSSSEFPLTSFLAINTEITKGKQRFEIKDPYQKRVIYEMNMSKYKEILIRKNPLYTWQPHYNQVKVFQLIK